MKRKLVLPVLCVALLGGLAHAQGGIIIKNTQTALKIMKAMQTGAKIEMTASINGIAALKAIGESGEVLEKYHIFASDWEKLRILQTAPKSRQAEAVIRELMPEAVLSPALKTLSPKAKRNLAAITKSTLDKKAAISDVEKTALKLYYKPEPRNLYSWYLPDGVIEADFTGLDISFFEQHFFTTFGKKDRREFCVLKVPFNVVFTHNGRSVRANEGDWIVSDNVNTARNNIAPMRVIKQDNLPVELEIIEAVLRGAY
ncbi:hypothetical protein [Parelusimicrobium proximum]|uniref:hypothetical protein n=1 Tax=Parelusimicrobium proximum TaxID=3228953 RepID=UPI003D183DC8